MQSSGMYETNAQLMGSLCYLGQETTQQTFDECKTTSEVETSHNICAVGFLICGKPTLALIP